MAIETDYLVIGSGAMGMAFTDVIMTETDATVTLVDRHDRPGGHWNDSYPFVRLHQPSSFYGVNSRKLGNDTIDATGWNEGLFELASGTEVVTYFEQVMQQQFLPSGRVNYFPMHEYKDGQIYSLVTGEALAVTVNAKTVDSTYMNVTVPSVTKPKYEVGSGIDCVPLNQLPAKHTEGQTYSRYTVIGAGKTGMDACLWMLRSGISADSIRWIMPRDSWMFDRRNIQPTMAFFDDTIVNAAEQLEAIAAATSIDDMFERLNRCGHLLRYDEAVKPTMWRCATVTGKELEQLQRITNVVREGRVESISQAEVKLTNGTIDIEDGELFIDCSSDGLERRPVVPVFEGDRITLQTVRTCQQVFSAAFIAHVEAAYESDELRNELCSVVPHPDTDIDFLRSTLQNQLNGARWSKDAELTAWLTNSRLDGFSRSPEELAEATEDQIQVAGRMLAASPAATAKLQQLLEEHEA